MFPEVYFDSCCQVCFCFDFDFIISEFHNGVDCGESTGADGIFRVTNEEGRYTAYLWDFKSMYVERVSSEEVLKRAKVRTIFRCFAFC